ncbi:prolyl oligopeptidase family serine peptidase [Amycolatopsis sp. OK19-0408]|uniref:Prolyl oligopeptidase family serine peptidase n=1 Tax=Amycolatopsis iheyensis TaxID=2945988 RepID=A0A9X2N5V6_9PSEU|nr:prolyl oligopeptidase family serine peptidase [Amycolatopsis iheyensis]MCR6482549.1 prolyl oligopeptidase family serine peptidase [Amycolatopsis iheyensis]
MGTWGELTAEAVAERAVPRTPRLSPDGRWVVYTLDSGLWLAPADGSAPPRQLVAGTAEQPRWARDSGSVFFRSERAQLHRIGLADAESGQLTDRPGGVSDHVPLTGSVVLVAPADDEPSGPRVRSVRADGSRAAWDTRARPDRLWLLDLRTGVTSPLGDLGARHVCEVAARPDGGALAVLTWSCADREPGVFEPGLHVVDLATGETRDLPTPPLEATAPTWWHDGSRWHLAHLGLTPPGLIGGTAVFDDGENLTAALDSCPTALAQVDDGPPLALFAEGLDTTVRRLDPATRRFTEVTQARGHLSALDASGETITVVVSTATETDDVHAGPAAGPWTRLSHAAPELDGIRWGAQERLHYRAADGLALDGVLVLPPGKTRADGPFPLVTLIHGGPADRYSDRLNLAWYPSGQWLAAAGFAVFLPNPRGSVGHGHAFAASVAGDVGGAEFTDVLTGIDLLVSEGVADETRLGIGGGSHGGFFAAWAVTQTDRFAAAVVHAGVIDWPMLAATGDHSRFEAALGGRENSPSTHAHRIRTPVLIMHGEDDTNVPLAQAELLHRALAGKHHEFVVYPGEGHSIRGREHRIDALNRARAWFSDLLA